MNEANKLLLTVLRRVQRHPISRIFNTPLDPTTALDLTVIENRIIQNMYRSSSEFMADIDRICQSAHMQFERTSQHVAAAAHLRYLIQKEMKVLLNSRDWCEEVYRIRSKIKSLIEKPPKMPPNIFSTGIDPSQPAAKQLPSDESLKRFMSMVHHFTSTEDLEAISQIIDLYQPGLVSKDGPQIDVRKLSKPTIDALLRFMKKQMLARGQSVPESAFDV
ncbi:Bromodomain containing protein [Tritrichomonas foetus]|uniref:Bromodomain containing protein n=1 Tax=Tritrichomonas foetus TaxID=1144522 RepID=A0A1J4J4V8_9EUKA|nr:Bromodomain containing protein [Tritrichomonas foetus]|eukprot:OHS93175.1 Bromodomain containing protein [Tritrichomonas foetus]